MKILAIAFGVRFFRVMISVGGAFIDKLTGNTLTRSRPAPKYSVEPGRKVRNRPISTSLVRTAVESETTCGVGGTMPAERKPSAINALATLSNSGNAQGSSKRSCEIDLAAPRPRIVESRNYEQRLFEQGIRFQVLAVDRPRCP